MSWNILDYFRKKPAELCLLDHNYAGSDRQLNCHYDIHIIFNMLMSLITDYNRVYHCTFTCKNDDYTYNAEHVKFLVRLLSQRSGHFKYILFPAYQRRMVIHFHGFIIYDHGKTIGRSAMKLLETQMNKSFGWTKIKHMRSECKSRDFDLREEVGKALEYDYNSENYGECREYFPITNINIALFSAEKYV